MAEVKYDTQQGVIINITLPKQAFRVQYGLHFNLEGKIEFNFLSSKCTKPGSNKKTYDSLDKLEEIANSIIVIKSLNNPILEDIAAEIINTASNQWVI